MIGITVGIELGEVKLEHCTHKRSSEQIIVGKY